MEPMIVLAPLLGTILIGAISPGPSFILVARTAIAVSRLDGLAAALGMGLGASFFAGAALLGLHAVLGVPSVYTALKLLGGAYLLYLAFRLWRGAGEPIAVPEASGAVPASVLKSFFLGLGTQVSNPKTAVVYASIFAALLPTGQTWSSGSVLVCLIFAVETAWYALLAVAFSAERPRQGY